MADEQPDVTAPPVHDPETNVAMLGDYPLNHRLRAEALHEAGQTTDPDGEIGDDLIRDAGERLAGEAEAARLIQQAKDDETRDVRALVKDELIAFAGRKSIPIDPTATKDVIQNTVLESLAGKPADEAHEGEKTDG